MELHEITLKLAQRGWDPLAGARHAGVLYPNDALRLVVAERAGMVIQVDQQLEALLRRWWAKMVPDPMAYLKELFASLEEDGQEGMWLRLEFAALDGMEPDEVRIAGVTVYWGPQKLGSSVRARLTRLLRSAGRPVVSLADVEGRIRQLMMTAPIERSEQILMGWIAFLMLRKLAASRDLDDLPSLPALTRSRQQALEDKP